MLPVNCCGMVIAYSRLTSGQRHCPERLFRKFTMEAFSLRAVWDEGYREAWFLISDQPAGRRRIQEYAWRMRVEATFEDAKSRGWVLEASLIEDRERLNRLLLALFHLLLHPFALFRARNGRIGGCRGSNDWLAKCDRLQLHRSRSRSMDSQARLLRRSICALPDR